MAVTQAQSLCVFGWGEVHIVDVCSLHYAVLYIVLKLPGIALHLLCCFLVQRVIWVWILRCKLIIRRHLSTRNRDLLVLCICATGSLPKICLCVCVSNADTASGMLCSPMQCNPVVTTWHQNFDPTLKGLKPLSQYVGKKTYTLLPLC